MRAVERYIKLGKRVGPTIRQLGYPTKHALKGWYWEYGQRLDLSVGYARREPRYSQGQKEAAVEHYLTHDRCIAATVRALGCPSQGHHPRTDCKVIGLVWKHFLRKNLSATPDSIAQPTPHPLHQAVAPTQG